MKAEHILPDQQNTVELAGITVRKGSVGAFLANARLLASDGATPAQRAEALADLQSLVPALAALGLFEHFALRDPALAQVVEAELGKLPKACV
ncbi:hypothetical protein [Chitinimonas sp.]|uniref:hypothetical protein n=1 Tax=Chitinimonas sp. TaxID=1934313 RepID=UPI002F95AAE6